MNPKAFFSSLTVLSAVLLSAALVAPANAQKAALTRDVDRPTAQPINGYCSGAGITGSPGSVKCNLYTVPMGKRLVVELVGYQTATASGTVVTQVLFGPDSGFSNIIMGSANVFPVTPGFTYDTAGTRGYSGSQSLTMYLDEGQTLAGQIYRNGNVYYLSYFSFSGYLVDK